MKLNHVMVKTQQPQQLAFLLTEIVGLVEGARPDFPFPGTWFYSEGQALIHVVEESIAHSPQASIDHVALMGADYTELTQKLRQYHIPYHEADVPLSQQRQVFIQAPDGLNIEMQFAFAELDINNHAINQHYRYG